MYNLEELQIMSRLLDNYLNLNKLYPQMRYINDKGDVFDLVHLAFIWGFGTIEVVFLCNILNQLNDMGKTLLVSSRMV